MKKRVLPLLLALSCAFSFPTLAAPAEPAAYTDADRIVYVKAVNTLSRLGVISGKEDGSFDPQGLVTRGECAKLFFAMLHGGDREALPDQPEAADFSDTEGHWAQGYISYCKEAHILNGRGNGLFDPDASVTGIEFAKMALAALGCEPENYSLTGASWGAYTNRRAVENCRPSLYKDLDEAVEVSEPITREAAAQILFNTLANPVIEKVPDTTSYPGQLVYHYRVKKDPDGQEVSFFSTYFDATKWETLSSGTQ